MVLRIQLVSHQKSGKFGSNIYEVIAQWRNFYQPPWMFLFHVLELLCVIFFCNLVIYPTIDGVYNTRKELVSFFFPENEENTPFGVIQDISDFFSTFLDNFEKLMRKSISNVYFADENKPYIFQTHWKNGTTSESLTVDLDSQLFQHISGIDVSTAFHIIANDTDVIGCTKWMINVSIVKSLGGYTFTSNPVISRDSCGSKYVRDDELERKRITRKRIFKKRTVDNYRDVEVRYDVNRAETDKIIVHDVMQAIMNGTLDKYVPPAKEKTSPIFQRQQLSLYTVMQRFGLMFCVLAALGLYINTINIFDLFEEHKLRLLSDGAYKELSTHKQFHTTIGMWNTFFLIKSILELIVAILIIADSTSLSQYPENQTIFMFGISGLIIVVCALRWFMQWPKCYRVVHIINKGISRLAIMFIGQAPIIVALAFAGTFLFGFVSRISQSFVKLLESFIALTFGDSLYSLYADFSDNSTEYNIMSFVYNTVLIAVMIWVFFTSYTAVMTYVDHHFISQLVK